jgi:outer membrane protein assembly factor BamD (BamD/ComL family)
MPLPLVLAAPPAPAPRHRPSADLNEPLLVDQARAALRRKLPDEAILALERHQREFPDGQLVEEREVLFIEAELMKGETAAAQARIARYLARFPHGLLRGYVESLAPAAPPLPQ